MTTGKAQIDFEKNAIVLYPLIDHWKNQILNGETRTIRGESSNCYPIHFVTTGKNRKKHLNKELKRILRIPRNVGFSGFFFFFLFVFFFEWCSCTCNKCCFLKVYLVSTRIAFHFITRALKLSIIDQSQTV